MDLYIDPTIIITDARTVSKKLQEEAGINYDDPNIAWRHEIVYRTDLPKRLEMKENIEANPYHFFFYMLARLYFFDNGKDPIPFYYRKGSCHTSEMGLALLPPRFQRICVKEDGYEYIETAGCNWHEDWIDEAWIYSYIRDLYKDIWINVKQERGKLVYISRSPQRVKQRAVLNEEEVISALRNVGVSCYTLEHMTFIDCIQLFRSASLITGAHGGGLAWAIFCHPGTVLCEVYKDKPKKGHYADLCKKCDLEFWRFTNVSGEQGAEGEVDDYSFSINIPDYIASIRQLSSRY